MGTTSGWKNRKGTSGKSCRCGTWSDHWINYSNKSWPGICSVSTCNNKATLGAHVYHSGASGDRIVPMCASCNAFDKEFDLKGNTSIPEAIKSGCS